MIYPNCRTNPKIDKPPNLEDHVGADGSQDLRCASCKKRYTVTQIPEEEW